MKINIGYKTCINTMLSLMILLVSLFISTQSVLSGSFKNLHLIAKDIMEEIDEVETPKEGSELGHVNIVALRGEYEPFTFSIYCKNGCKQFSIIPTNLKRVDGKKKGISSEHIEVHSLKRGKTQYNVNDWILTPIEEINIVSGRSVRIWVTIHVPESALPGLYMANLKIDLGTEILLPITLKVLPQKHESPSDVQFAVLYTVSPIGQYYSHEKHSRLESNVLNFYKDLKAHGMTSISPKCSDWPYKKGIIDGLKAEVSLAVKAGLRGPVLWYMSALINGAKGGKKYAHYDGKCDNWNELRDLVNLREIIAVTKEMVQKEGWPDVVFITVDEPGTDTEDRYINSLRMEILEKSMKVVSGLGVRAATTVTELVDNRHNESPFSRTPNELREFWDKIRPFCDIRIYGYGYPQGETNLYAEKKDAHKREHEVWFYNNEATMGQNRFLARTYFGIWGWKVGANGLTSWTYPGARTVQWEIVREGIDDLKYLKLIERLIHDENVDSKTIKRAKDFLNEVSSSIKLNKNGYVKSWKTRIESNIFRNRAVSIIEKLSINSLCSIN